MAHYFLHAKEDSKTLPQRIWDTLALFGCSTANSPAIPGGPENRYVLEVGSDHTVWITLHKTVKRQSFLLSIIPFYLKPPNRFLNTFPHSCLLRALPILYAAADRVTIGSLPFRIIRTLPPLIRIPQAISQNQSDPFINVHSVFSIVSNC